MTTQAKERLIFKGETYHIACCPPLPKHPRVTSLENDEIDLIPNPLILSTACWRRYIGTWEIKDNRFYLVDLSGGFHLDGNTPLFADWFSGNIPIPQGPPIQHVFMRHYSIYEKELQITIEHGFVVRTEVVDNREMKH